MTKGVIAGALLSLFGIYFYHVSKRSESVLIKKEVLPLTWKKVYYYSTAIVSKGNGQTNIFTLVVNLILNRDSATICMTSLRGHITKFIYAIASTLASMKKSTILSA